LRLFPDYSDRLKQRLRRIGLPKKSDWVQCRSAFERPLIDIGGSEQDWNGLLRLQPSRHFDTGAVVGELDIHHHQFRLLAFGLGHRRTLIRCNTDHLVAGVGEDRGYQFSDHWLVVYDQDSSHALPAGAPVVLSSALSGRFASAALSRRTGNPRRFTDGWTEIPPH